MSRLIVAALVLLLGIGSLFCAAAWNRGGDSQSIELTERELELPWTSENGRADADAELRLMFRWQLRAEPQDARVWLSEVTLRALGFGSGLPAGAPEAALVYGRSLPRVAWVAFEYDGPAWKTIEQRGPWHAPTGPSRRRARPVILYPSTLVWTARCCAAATLTERPRDAGHRAHALCHGRGAGALGMGVGADAGRERRVRAVSLARAAARIEAAGGAGRRALAVRHPGHGSNLATTSGWGSAGWAPCGWRRAGEELIPLSGAIGNQLPTAPQVVTV